MATYIIVSEDKDPLGPNEINAGETIEVNDGDVFIVDPTADDDIEFESASGSSTSFEVRFEQSNANKLKVTFDDDLNPTINISDDVDLGRTSIDAKDADSVTLNAGNGVTLDKYDGSEDGVDTFTAGDDFTMNKSLNTEDGDDVITIGANASIKDIKTKDGDDTVSIGPNATIEKIETGKGDDNVTIGANATIGKIDGGKGDDSIRIGPNSDIGKVDSFEIEQVVCFTSGTLITTAAGPVAIEDLKVGDMVTTLDHGEQPIRWIGSRTVNRDELSANPKLRPVRISVGALGNGLPTRDLIVSRQHRVLARSNIARRMFNTSEVLIPAHKLVGMDGIDIVEDATEVTYIHLLFARHEILFSEGAATESLYPGRQALTGLGAEAVEEIIYLFPELADGEGAPKPARLMPAKGRQVTALASRHSKNRKPLVDSLS